MRERVERSLRTLCGQEAFREFVAELRARAEITVDEAVLADPGVWRALEAG